MALWYLSHFASCIICLALYLQCFGALQCVSTTVCLSTLQGVGPHLTITNSNAGDNLGTFSLWADKRISLGYSKPRSTIAESQGTYVLHLTTQCLMVSLNGCTGLHSHQGLFIWGHFYEFVQDQQLVIGKDYRR